MFVVRDSQTNFCLLKVAMKLLVRGIFSFVPYWMSRSLNKEIGNGVHFLHKYLCNEIYAYSRHRNKFCRNPTKENELAFKKQKK